MYGCLSNFDNNSYIRKIIPFDEIVCELKLKTKIIHEFFKSLYLFEGTNRKNWWTKKVISFVSGMEHMYMSKTHTVYWVYPSSSAHIKMNAELQKRRTSHCDSCNCRLLGFMEFGERRSVNFDCSINHNWTTIDFDFSITSRIDTENKVSDRQTMRLTRTITIL